MAGEKVPEVYFWKVEADELDIFMASSGMGAMRIGMELNKGTDCLDFFYGIFPGNRLIKDEPMNRYLLDAVKAVLGGGPVPEDLPLDIKSTPFQGMVWKAIARIPFGQKRTYGEVATIIGRPGGARAVGQAMNKNPLPLIYP
jgi:O6-methylguanine-DNA--protein-cysteine methyltransferase